MPKANEYLKNGVISSEVHVVLVRMFFFLGPGITKRNVDIVDNFPEIIYSIAMILRLWDDLGIGFKKSVKSGMTRSICNRLRANCDDTDTRYETMSGSIKTQLNSVDSVEFDRLLDKLDENTENRISLVRRTKKFQTKFQTFIDSFEKPKHL